MFETLKSFSEMIESSIKPHEVISAPEAQNESSSRKSGPRVGMTKGEETLQRKEEAKYNRISKQAEQFLVNTSANKAGLKSLPSSKNDKSTTSTMSVSQSSKMTRKWSVLIRI